MGIAGKGLMEPKQPSVQSHALFKSERRGCDCVKTEGSDTDHKTLQSPGTERSDKGRIYPFPEPHPWLNDTEFGHLVSVSVRKEKKKKKILPKRYQIPGSWSWQLQQVSN